MKSFKAGELLEVQIEKLSLGGNGIARHSGLVIFIPFSAPGDSLKIEITEVKKNFAEGRILEILMPSSFRTKPPCPVFGTCGGCNWQHLQYSEQLNQKQLILEEQLKGLIDPRLIEIIQPSPLEFRYRNRIQLKSKAGKVGFFKRGSHDIVDINDCPITLQEITAEIPKLRNNTDPNKLEKRLELQLDRQGKVHLSNEDSPFEGEGFSQINEAQNQNLIRELVNWCKPIQFSQFIDLYAGAGNFTFPIFEAFPKAKITAVELHPKSVQIGREKLKTRSLSPKQIEFYLSDVENFLKRSLIPKDSLVLLDPPRIGCSENVIKYLAQQPLQRMFYISCNPSALRRDILRLKSFNSRWQILRAKPFDMFPQTDHIETLVELGIDT